MFNSEKIINLPKEFSLFGHKYKIILENDLLEKENIFGSADDDLKLIKLQNIGTAIRRYEEDGVKVETNIDITQEVLGETFFHEVIHIIFDALGETELSENEKLVNMMGKALLEVYLSSVYEKDSKKEV